MILHKKDVQRTAKQSFILFIAALLVGVFASVVFNAFSTFDLIYWGFFSFSLFAFPTFIQALRRILWLGEVERDWPSFLDEVSENISIGLRVEDAIEKAGENAGALTQLVQMFADLLADGATVPAALDAVGEEIENNSIKFSLKSIALSYTEGVDMQEVFESKSKLFEEKLDASKSARSRAILAMVVVYVCAFALIIVLRMMAGLSAGPLAGGAFNLFSFQPDPEITRFNNFLISISLGASSGPFIGEAQGDMYVGLGHSIALAAIVVAAFALHLV